MHEVFILPWQEYPNILNSDSQFSEAFQSLPKLSEDVRTTFEHFQSYFNGNILHCSMLW